jgi:hypothetical protein
MLYSSTVGVKWIDRGFHLVVTLTHFPIVTFDIMYMYTIYSPAHTLNLSQQTMEAVNEVSSDEKEVPLQC